MSIIRARNHQIDRHRTLSCMQPHHPGTLPLYEEDQMKLNLRKFGVVLAIAASLGVTTEAFAGYWVNPCAPYYYCNPVWVCTPTPYGCY